MMRAVLLLFIGACVAQIIQTDHWAQFHGGPRRTGYQNVTGPATNTVRQVIKIGADLGNGTSQSAVVVGPNGVMYVPTADKLGGVLAFSSDGKLLWSYRVFAATPGNTTSRVFSTPALSADGTTLYVADAFMVIIALDAAKGTPLWNVSTCEAGKIPNACGSVMGALLLDDFTSSLYFGARDGWLWKVRTDLRMVEWKTFLGATEAGGPSTYPGNGGFIFIATDPIGMPGGTYHCVSAGTGTIRWSAPIGTSVSVPTIDAELNTYLGSFRGTFFSFDLHGNQRWSYTPLKDDGTVTFRRASTAPALGPDNSIYASGCLSRADPTQCMGYMVKLSAKTGEVVWQTVDIDSKGEVGYGGHYARLGAPVIDAAGHVYQAHNDGTVYCFSALSGELLWTFDAGAAIDGYLSLTTEGKLLVPTGGGPKIGPHDRSYTNCTSTYSCAVLVF